MFQGSYSKSRRIAESYLEESVSFVGLIFSFSWLKRAFYKALFLSLRMAVPSPVRVVLALSYLTLISFLFCLPGSAIPKVNFLSEVHFDKWVHVGFFFVLALLWLWSFAFSKNRNVLLLVGAAGYGFLVELVQHYFIANRSFDVGDLIADIAGAALGLIVWWRYQKNRPL